MSHRISRREFLKVTGLGAGAAAVLTGCGPASRYVKRHPYTDMPEYNVTGQSTYFATTCGECSAGCGLIVRTMEGRAIKVEGNPQHPVNQGATCSRGQATLQGLYNPDRIQGPGKQASRGSGRFDPLKWDAAIGIVKDALLNNQPDQIAFLLGMFPDHLYDLIQLIAKGLGGASVLRYGTLGEFDGRKALVEASQAILGEARLPYFDLANTDMVFSFGANFVETWLSPVSYADSYGIMRQGHTGRRGYFVQFEPRMSQTAASADEWFPILPGSEALLAQGLGALISEMKGSVPAAYANVDLAQVTEQTGISEYDLRRLAALFAGVERPLAIPGGVALGTTSGRAAAESILALNVLMGNLGKEGGLFWMPDSPLYPEHTSGLDSIAQISRLIDQMSSGQIKVLFVHGANPVYDLPKSYGFEQALGKVPLVISFASFPDETAALADVVLPDHTPLEAWGYQKVVTGSYRTALSGLQPTVVPLYDTHATADVLLAAVQAVGGDLATAVNFSDEVDFLMKSVSVLMDQGGTYTAPSAEAFWVLWQQNGGWWKSTPDLVAPQAAQALDRPIDPGKAQFSGTEAEFGLFLLPFPSPNLGDGSAANRPVLQEVPDPSTTVMWDSWVEVNPQTAQKLGIRSDDVVKIHSPVGDLEVVVYEFPAIHPGVVAIPLGQGHTAFGRFAQGRGIMALNLLDKGQNESGGLAFLGTRVQISPTGKRRLLARYESREGVYGKGILPQGG